MRPTIAKMIPIMPRLMIRKYIVLFPSSIYRDRTTPEMPKRRE
jgi:hypothetical protein